MTSTDPIADTILAAGFAFTVYLGLRNGHKTDRAADNISGKVDAQAGKIDDVHNLVNSQLSDAIDRKDVAEARNRVLEGEHKEVQP